MTRRARKKKVMWDLYRDGISYSLLSKFVACRERFRIHAVEGMRVAGSTDHLDFGNVFHKYLELSAKGFNNFQLQQWRDKNSNDLVGHLGYRIFEVYQDTWRSQDTGISYISSEDVFEVPVYLPSGRIVKLCGKYDEVFRKHVSNRLWLQENKTKGQVDEYAISHTLAHNLQTMLYSFTMGTHYNEHPEGVLYNVIRKPGLKQGVKESDSEFIQRVMKDIDKRPEWYFYRWHVEFAPNDVMTFAKHTLFPLLEQVCLWWESIKANPFQPWTLPDGSINPHHYIRPFGIYDPFRNGKGDFFDLITRGVETGLEVCEDPFPELEPEVLDENLN